MINALFFPGSIDSKCWKDPSRMLWNADRFPIILREASWSSTPASGLGEGERTPEDILTRLADGKRRIKENESELFSYGKIILYNLYRCAAL